MLTSRPRTPLDPDRMRRLASLVCLSVLAVASACGTDEPQSVQPDASPYAGILAAMDEIDDLNASGKTPAEPNVETLNEALGWGPDAPYRFTAYDVDFDAGRARMCVEGEGVYLALPDTDSPYLLGEGGCTYVETAAAVVLGFDGETPHVGRGQDLLPADFLRRADEETAKADARTLARDLNAYLEVMSDAEAPATVDDIAAAGLPVDFGNGSTLKEFAGENDNFAFCVVHDPSGAWALYESEASDVIASGSTGGACVL